MTEPEPDRLFARFVTIASLVLWSLLLAICVLTAVLTLLSAKVAGIGDDQFDGHLVHVTVPLVFAGIAAVAVVAASYAVRGHVVATAVTGGLMSLCGLLLLVPVPLIGAPALALGISSFVVLPQTSRHADWRAGQRPPELPVARVRSR